MKKKSNIFSLSPHKNLKYYRPDITEAHLFREPWKAINTMYMHQCPNPLAHSWIWGDNIFNMV